ncbi:MAG TPA: c-type cytochrome domain-containing protein [Roseimicrobium sp.]|nr:c-type cytochrome domain-containing protein [Roseimicrobium sp.]
MSQVFNTTGRRRFTQGFLCAGVGLHLAASAAGAAQLDFYRDVYPILKANCISCHNKTMTKADLDMETPESMKKGGASGPGIVPGKSRDSLIVKASLHQADLEMPPANNKSGAMKLTSAEVAALKAWIDQGAKASVQQERQVVWQAPAVGVHPIYTVAMTKDGRFAACGRSGEIDVYDLATRQSAGQITDDAQKSGSAHRAMVQSLAFSPDGTRLASGSFREVKIWRQDRVAAANRKGTGAMISALSPDGTLVVGADKSGNLKVTDVAKGTVLRKISNVSKSGVRLMAVSPDAGQIAVLGLDSVLSVWNLQTGLIVSSHPVVGGVLSMIWIADGKSLAVASEDKSVRVWSVPAAGVAAEMAMLKELKGAGSTNNSIAISPAADRLVIAGDDGKVRIWSIAEAKMLKEIASTGVTGADVSPDGKQLATCGTDGVVRIWDVESGKQVVELRGNVAASRQIAALEWTVATQTLEQAYRKTEITRIEAQNKALEELLKKANEAIVEMGKLVPEKQKALKPAQDATAVAQKAVDEIIALIAKAPGGKADEALEKQLKDAQEKLAPVSMMETSAQAAVSAVETNLKDAQDEVVRITETKAKNTTTLAESKTAIETAKTTQDKATADLTAARQALTKPGQTMLSVAFSSDSQRVAAILADGTIHVWAIASGTPVEQSGGISIAGSVLRPGADGAFVALNPDGSLSTTSGNPHWVLERVLGTGKKDKGLFADRVNAVRFSPDGLMLATGGGEPSRSGDISLFDVATGKPLATWKNRHTDSVLSLDFSPDGKLLASGAADKIARVSDVITGKQVNLFEGHTAHVTGVTFRADGRVLASAGADGAVIAWDMIMGERKRKIEGWTKEVTSLQFIGASNQIVTSAGDNLVRIINDDGAEVRAISKLPDFMQSAASTATANVVIGGGEDSYLRVWDGTTGKEITAFGAKGALTKRN